MNVNHVNLIRKAQGTIQKVQDFMDADDMVRDNKNSSKIIGIYYSRRNYNNKSRI